MTLYKSRISGDDDAKISINTYGVGMTTVMRIKTIGTAVLALVALALSGCQQGEGGPVTVTAAPAAPVGNAQPGGVPSAAAAPTDPAPLWCGKLSALGTKGTPDEYRTIATALIGATMHVTLAAAALRLHDATGTSINPVDTTAERATMIEAVLNVAQECLRVTN